MNAVNKETVHEWYNKYIVPVNKKSNHEAGFTIMWNRMCDGRLEKSERTVKRLGKKYKEYVDVWMVDWQDQEVKYIPRDERLKPFDQFLINGMHLHDHGIRIDARYRYLFGDRHMDVVKESFKQFQEKCKSPWQKRKER